ncbi:putative RNA-binding protein 10 [Hypsibius exemplaris]|uniref:RNA-binding protein 10 n=1 Tax=Hypsibius exemplaris TaxID=2072580 RepID=A0A1W0X926_HYPEX|nr:putative RNA-binding protein 10 [Hypsibius exemplaris]
MYNNDGQWVDDPEAYYAPAFGGPSSSSYPDQRRPPLHSGGGGGGGMGMFGARGDHPLPGQSYGRQQPPRALGMEYLPPPSHQQQQHRGGRGSDLDPATQFGSRELRQDRGYSEDRRDRQRRRSRSRSPSSRYGHDSNREEREWDRGKRSSSGRHSPPSSSYRGGGGYDQQHRDDDSRDHDRGHRGDRRERSFHDDPPSKTIMLRNLPHGCFEAEVRHALGLQLGGFVDIRVPRNPEGGNRGFGFLEFSDIPSASVWMDQVEGSIVINDQRVAARFSESREPFKKREEQREPRPNLAAVTQTAPADWECARCGCNNFRHRSTCFRCEAPRNEAELVNIPSADDQVGLTPCGTLLLRNLDILTDDAKITSALTSVLGSVQLKSVRIVRDPRTNQSVGYGFAQFKSVGEATEMYNCLMKTNPPLTIDNKQVAVSFAKLAPIESPQPSSSAPATSAVSRPPYVQGHNANSGAAVAQIALQQLQKAQLSASVVHSAAMHGQAAFSMPGYVYDASSGLYFEPNSKMYYDPKTQYFFNPETQQYLMWNAHTRQYVQVVSQAAASVAAAVPVPEPPKPIVEEKPRPEDEKKKQAEKIVQEMEKWAKAMNQKQPVQQKKAPLPDVKIGVVASVFKDDDGEDGAEDLALAQTKLSYKSMSIPAKPFASTPSVSSAPEPVRGRVSPVEASDREESRSPPGAALQQAEPLSLHMAAERKLVDWERFACLLCKRQLQSRDLLQKHTEMSDLHLRNLEAWRLEHLTEAEIDEIEANERDLRYRDRAKERRLKHGDAEPAPAPRERAPQPSSAERRRHGKKRSAARVDSDEEDSQTTGPAPGLGSDNVGAKLMKAMGWDEGKGLGKSKQGIVDPVEARGHSGTTGLGAASEGAPDILPNDSYANKVRKTMRQRFNQMQE